MGRGRSPGGNRAAARPAAGPSGRAPRRPPRGGVHASTWAREGATPETPMKGAPGMRTRGSCGEVAQPSAIVQCDEKRRRHEVAEIAEARDDGAERPRLGHDLPELRPRAGLLDARPSRPPGQSAGWMAPTGTVAEIGDRRPRSEVAVEGVAGLERHILALAHLHDRLDVGMPAVVPGPRLLGERLPSIDRDRPASLRFLPHPLSPLTRTPSTIRRLATDEDEQERQRRQRRPGHDRPVRLRRVGAA